MKNYAIVSTARIAALMLDRCVIIVGSEEMNAAGFETHPVPPGITHVVTLRDRQPCEYKIAAFDGAPIKSKNKRARREARGW